jgi:hypothetical protein
MNAEKQFAKIFDLKRGQLLITKVYDAEEEQNSIRAESQFNYPEMSVNPAAIFGYDSFEERNEAFLKFTEEMAQKLFEDFENILV